MKTIGSGKYEVNYRGRKSGENGYNHNMKNADRVQLEAINLLSMGIIEPASDLMKEYFIGSKVYICREPEALDTFQGWKEKGYHVKRGQKAITEIKLYQGYGWKKYYFFSQSQVSR